MRESELIIYRNLCKEKLFGKMAELMGLYDKKGENVCEEEQTRLLYSCLHGLIDLASEHGFRGNLWHCYLANLIVNDENSYSLACEMRGKVSGSVNDAAFHDICIFKEFYEYDFTDMSRKLHCPELSLIEDYDGGNLESKVYNTRICEKICGLADELGRAQTAEEMKDIITEFYREYGVGKFGLHKSFRVEKNDEGVQLVPILKIAHVKLNDLVGYDIAKKKLTDNTEAFVSGRKANNCLLFGDAGTGKSTSIKAIANEYYERGLRIIEIYRHQFQCLNDVIAQIKNRNYKFIIYMDDLSFEDFETEYKYLKAVIEGGLERKPENVLIYATSNRRHLIRENYSDREEIREDMHTGDTVQEKLSLAYRFGVTIFFGAPDQKQFKEIVKTLADRNDIRMAEEELLLEANKWELSHGGLSGRTAQQFVDYLLSIGIG